MWSCSLCMTKRFQVEGCLEIDSNSQKTAILNWSSKKLYKFYRKYGSFPTFQLNHHKKFGKLMNPPLCVPQIKFGKIHKQLGNTLWLFFTGVGPPPPYLRGGGPSSPFLSLGEGRTLTPFSSLHGENSTFPVFRPTAGGGQDRQG